MITSELENAVFYPAINENGNVMFTNVTGGLATRSPFAFPFGYYWTGTSVGNFLENRFFGNICVIYFFGDSGGVTITVNGNNIFTGVAVSSFPKVGAFRVLRLSNLSDDYNVVRITVTTTNVNVVGMLIHKFNAPFLSLSPTTNFNSTNMLNAPLNLYSTSTPLGANGSVSSTFIDLETPTRTINWILVSVFSNQSGTLFVEFSNDNTNADSVITINYTANTTPYIEPIRRAGRYVRFRYVNGATAQTVFRLFVRGVSSSM